MADKAEAVSLTHHLYAQGSGVSFDSTGAYSHQPIAYITVNALSSQFNDNVVAVTGESLPLATDDGLLKTATLYVETNQAYSIVLQTSVKSEGVGHAIAFADPMIAVDPALNPDTQIVVSEGISNTVADIPLTSAVPEPAEGALLAAGIAALALRGRRTSMSTLRTNECSAN